MDHGRATKNGRSIREGHGTRSTMGNMGKQATVTVGGPRELPTDTAWFNYYYLKLQLSEGGPRLAPGQDSRRADPVFTLWWLSI